jgi:hypothetical protein
VLITLAGLVVVAIGVGMMWYGAAKKFEKRLMIARMSGRTRTAAVRLGQTGYGAKGIAFSIVGVLIVEAASTHDPARSRGLDAALRVLLDQPYGPVLLILIAVGFAAFGLYCFLQARYRKVKT